MPSENGHSRDTIDELARRIRPELNPINKQFSWFPMTPVAEEDQRQYLQDPIESLPPVARALLPKIGVVLAPYLEKGVGRAATAVAETKPAEAKLALSARVESPDFVTIFFTVKGEQVADYHYFFYDEIAALRPKLAVVLVQLPPSLEFNGRVVRAFFKSVPRLRGTKMVCEPRHPSWFTNAAASILQEAGISRVAADPARCLGAEVPGGARRLAYFRWHGSPHVYYSKYSAAQLTTFAAAVNTNKATETWCVFDNTAHYAAWDDALQFAAALQPMQRVQLKRCKGWRMPANTVKVDRTTRWGNHPAARAGVAGAEAVRVFAQWVDNEAPEDWKSAALLALQKKNLACWCKEGASCHADFLISWIASCQQTSMK